MIIIIPPSPSPSLSLSSASLCPLPRGGAAAGDLLLPPSLSVLLRWPGGLRGPGSVVPASPSPPASGESLPPASQQQARLAGSLCLRQSLLSGGLSGGTLKLFIVPYVL